MLRGNDSCRHDTLRTEAVPDATVMVCLGSETLDGCPLSGRGVTWMHEELTLSSPLKAIGSWAHTGPAHRGHHSIKRWQIKTPIFFFCWEIQAPGREETRLSCFPLPDARKSGGPLGPDPGKLGVQRLLCWSSWNCIYTVLTGFVTPKSHQGFWSL